MKEPVTEFDLDSPAGTFPFFVCAQRQDFPELTDLWQSACRKVMQMVRVWINAYVLGVFFCTSKFLKDSLESEQSAKTEKLLESPSGTALQKHKSRRSIPTVVFSVKRDAQTQLIRSGTSLPLLRTWTCLWSFQSLARYLRACSHVLSVWTIVIRSIFTLHR